MKKTLLIIAFFNGLFLLQAQSVKLQNGLVERTFQLSDNNHLTSSSYSQIGTKGAENNIINSGSPEFSFLCDNKAFSGLSTWDVSVKDTTLAGGGNGYSFLLKSKEKAGLTVVVSYLIFPNLPLIKKQLKFLNQSAEPFMIEALKVEELNIKIVSYDAWVMRNYGRYKHLGPYIGDWDDPLVVVHDATKQLGIAIGNEVIGVLKRTVVFENGSQTISSGLTLPNQNFAFRKWIGPGDSWESPAIFTALYSGTNNPYDVINTTVSDYTRKYLGSRIEANRRKPMFVYNTWYPFEFNINHDLIVKLADAAAECGIEEFVIDDGWQRSYGDWEVDTKKFPGGLKPTFDYIRQKGMKPGIWMSVARADSFTNVYKNHPEWFVKNQNQQFCNLHEENAKLARTACMGTAWKDYIQEKVQKLVSENGLAYAKLDFAVVTSPYLYKPEISGCYATNHPFHADHAESYDAIYSRTMSFFDDLHKFSPDLFIDCTYETAGRLNMNDYGIVKHAEGNWLSNILKQPLLVPCEPVCWHGNVHLHCLLRRW